MFNQASLADAAAQPWDVVIAGSSFAAMFFLRGLPRGLRVLVVEKGALIGHATQIADYARPRDIYLMQNRSGAEKDWVAHIMFGGNSNCWWGQVPRFHPNDFRLYEDHGRAASWPVDYDTLEPFYSEVEQVMEVAGGGLDHIFPRSAPYPFAHHALSRSDLAARESRADIWVPVPTARSNGGSRALCCANGVCDLCPVDAKFTIQNGFAAFDRPGVTMVRAEARAVERTAGRASGLRLRARDGAEAQVRAPLVALGTNAMSNAAIMLRSGLRSPALGRYLHEQSSVELVVDVGVPGYFGGSSITGHCYGFYDGSHRSDAAAVLIENYNAPNSLRTDRGRWTHRMKLKLIAEDEPSAENRVELDASGEPQVTWTGHSAYAAAGLSRAETNLAGVLPFALERIAERRVSKTEAHIQGTHRMGRDPAGSVVDANSMTHEVAGLYALGAGVFPASSAANPTLTLSALALMAGRSVA